MGKENEQWDTIRNYNVTGGNTNQSCAKTILSMREDIARKLSAYSRLEGVEAIGCIFDTTQDEAARQVSGFVVGSDFIVKLINEHQLDARAILDWVVTAMKAKGYNISMPQFTGGVGAYEILLSKPNEAPRDRYRRIWPIMVLEHTSKFGYQPKAVQWRKLLDYAFQYKFMINNWPDDVPPIGPDFNPHNLSSQHLKLLVVPFIKSKGHSYYEAELRTEAESLLEIEKKKSKGKHRGQKRTVEDVMSELDVNVPEIKFAAWPDECVNQLNDEVSVPEDMLAVHEAHPNGHIASIQETLPSDHESAVTLSPPTLPSIQCRPANTTAVHHREENHPTQVPDLFDRESRPVLPTSRDEPVGSGRRQTSLLFKAKKTLQVDPALVRHMEERPTHSRNDTDLGNFAAPNRRRQYSRSPPVYPEHGEPSRGRYYQPTYRQREPSPFADDEDYSYPRHHTYSCRENQADDNSRRFQVRGTGKNYAAHLYQA
ncbi:hypothetical protein F4604DRAFT_1932455 [Suillus subluteus]|nr:hypothetical protein F4604DRAFT_1932455 [Suillus subluteus]